MLNQDILNQLRTAFEKLENTIQLVYFKSDHEKQDELVKLLSQISESSDYITTHESDKESNYPRFLIKYKDQENGVYFSGIPGGHEFSSLVLAILNSDLKGKLPDDLIQKRIKNLKGPIRLKTFISLSCENCPAVVQSLNLMAIIHPDFEHEMIDGEFLPEEIEKYKIQGVPAVVGHEKLLSSGKSDLTTLIQKLEDEFGSQEVKASENIDLGLFDVAIIGAGPAGISSAIYSARKGLKTAIITDRIGGQLQETKGIENFVSTLYTEGPELSDKLYKHLIEHDVQVFEHRRVSSIKKQDYKKLISLDSGESLKSKSLIVATGAKWRELGVPGEKDYLGRGVAFCPHCDGPYYKGKDIAVIGGGNSGVEAAIDLAGIVKTVTVFEFMPELKADQILIDKMNSLENIKVIKNAKTEKILGDGQKVNAIVYQDRSTEEIHQLDLDGVFVQIGLVPNSDFIKDLVETNQYGEILIDNKCRTSEPGIFAAGDVTNVPYKQIIVSMGEGAKASLSSYEELMLSSI